MTHPFIDPLALTDSLVRFPSETPDNTKLQSFVADGLKQLGFKIQHFNQHDRLNLLARLGDNKRTLFFSGHSDVVPAGELSRWSSHPYQPMIKDGYIVGRGTSDMKGNVACFLAAIARYCERLGQPKTLSLGVLLAGDEEHDHACGTRDMVTHLRANGTQIDFAIVAEPSSSENLCDTIRIGRRGSHHAVINVRGRQGHVAYPDKAKNAIHCALPALNELVSTPLDSGSKEFPASSLQITLVESDSGASNVIPALLSCRLNIRYSPLHTPQSLQQHCEEIFSKHGVECQFEWFGDAQPFITKPGFFTDLIGQAIQARLKVTPRLDTGGGTSDARFIAAPGTEVVEIGLINKTIHQVDERISVSDLEPLTELFIDIISKLESANQ